MVSVTLSRVSAKPPKKPLPQLVNEYQKQGPFLSLNKNKKWFAAFTLAFLVTPGVPGLGFLALFAICKTADYISQRRLRANIVNSIHTPEDKAVLRETLQKQELPKISNADRRFQQFNVAVILITSYLTDLFYGISEQQGALLFATVFSFVVLLRKAIANPAKTEAQLTKALKKRGIDLK
jgi:hypothetical protein